MAARVVPYLCQKRKASATVESFRTGLNDIIKEVIQKHGSTCGCSTKWATKVQWHQMINEFLGASLFKNLETLKSMATELVGDKILYVIKAAIQDDQYAEIFPQPNAHAR